MFVYTCSFSDCRCRWLRRRRHDGAVVDLNLGPFALLGAASQAEAGLAAPSAPLEPAASETAGFDRKLIGILILGVNGTLLLAILLTWFYRRRKRHRAAAARTDPTAHDEGEAPAPRQAGGDDGSTDAATSPAEAEAAQGDAAAEKPVGESPAAPPAPVPAAARKSASG